MIDDRIKKIYNHFGKENQIDKTIEELGELHEAISFSRFTNKDVKDDGSVEYYSNIALYESTKTDIIQEMADVKIMLLQLQLAFNITDDELNEQIEFKINRTLDRIKEGYYE